MKFNAKLPEGNNNGLTVIEQELIDNPDKVHVVVALIEAGDELHKRTGDIIPSVTLRAIEVVREDQAALARILRRAKDTRTGSVVLPFETEEHIATIFGGVDLVTGEIKEPAR